MKKTLYVITGNVRYSYGCDELCKECNLRFRCWTDAYVSLEITQEEFRKIDTHIIHSWCTNESDTRGRVVSTG